MRTVVVRPALQTTAKLAYVVGMLALVSVGTVNMLARTVEDAKLFGVESDAKEPKLSLSEIWNEGFQRDFTAWFDQHWGLRGYAVRTDNTFVLALFGESRSGKAVPVRNGALISEEDLTYVNRADGPEATIAHAKNIARVQSKMRERGKVLVPVLIPAKTSFVRKDIPYL